MNATATCSTAATTAWRLMGPPVFLSLTGRALRFEVELDLPESSDDAGDGDYAVIDCTVLVETFAGSPCCEVLRLDVERAHDWPAAAAWCRLHIDELADAVVFR